MCNALSVFSEVKSMHIDLLAMYPGPSTSKAPSKERSSSLKNHAQWQQEVRQNSMPLDFKIHYRWFLDKVTVVCSVSC